MLINPGGSFTRLYLPALLYMALIFTLSSFHTLPLQQIDQISLDKIYHCLEYAVLGYLLTRLLEQGWRMQGFTMFLLAASFGIAFALSDEIHQIFVPGRFFSYWDIAADSLGAVAGCWIYLKLRF